MPAKKNSSQKPTIKMPIFKEVNGFGPPLLDAPIMNTDPVQIQNQQRVTVENYIYVITDEDELIIAPEKDCTGMRIIHTIIAPERVCAAGIARYFVGGCKFDPSSGKEVKLEGHFEIYNASGHFKPCGPDLGKYTLAIFKSYGAKNTTFKYLPETEKFNAENPPKNFAGMSSPKCLEELSIPQMRINIQNVAAATADHSFEAPPTDYRIGASAQQQPHVSGTQWNPLTAFIPAILRSELQGSERSESSLEQKSQQVKFNMRHEQYCTTIELAIFLRGKPNKTVTIDEAREFGMSRTLFEKIRNGEPLISISESGETLSLSEKVFQERFPNQVGRTGNRESYELGVLDRQNRCFIRKDNVSAEDALPFLKEKLTHYAKQKNLMIMDVLYDGHNYTIKFVPARLVIIDDKTANVIIDFANKPKAELLKLYEASAVHGDWECRDYYEPLVMRPPTESVQHIVHETEKKCLELHGRRLGETVQISQAYQNISSKPCESLIWLCPNVNYNPTTRTITFEKGCFSFLKLASEDYTVPMNEALKNMELMHASKKLQSRTTELIKFECILPRPSTAMVNYPEGERTVVAFTPKATSEIPHRYNPEFAKAIAAAESGDHFRGAASHVKDQRVSDYTHPLDYDRIDSELAGTHRNLTEAGKYSRDNPHLSERIHVANITDHAAQSKPPTFTAQNATQPAEINFNRPAPKTLAGILSLLELQGKTEFTLAELKALGISADRLHRWRLRDNSILQTVDGDNTVILDLERAHQRLRSKIEYPGKGTLYLHQKLFIPVPGFEAHAEAFLASKLTMKAELENVRIGKLVYCPKTFAFRAEYLPFEVNEITVGSATTTQINIKAATYTKKQCYAVAEQKAGAGFWLSQDYHLQIAEIAETPTATKIGETLIHAISKNGESGQLLGVSDQYSKNTPAIRGKSERLGALDHAFCTKTRTLMLSSEVNNANLLTLKDMYGIGKITSATFRVAFKHIIPAIGIFLSTANIARAETGQKVKVAATEGALHAGGIIGATLGTLVMPGLPAAVLGGMIVSEAVAHRLRPETGASAMHHNHMPRFKSTMNATHPGEILLHSGHKIWSSESLNIHQAISEKEKTTLRYIYTISANGEFKFRDSVYPTGRKSVHTDLTQAHDVIAAGEIIFIDGKCIVNNKSEYQTRGPQIAPFVLEKLSRIHHVVNAEFHYEPGTQYLERDKLPNNCILPKKLPSGTPQDCLFQKAPSTTQTNSVAQYENLLGRTVEETKRFYPTVAANRSALLAIPKKPTATELKRTHHLEATHMRTKAQKQKPQKTAEEIRLFREAVANKFNAILNAKELEKVARGLETIQQSKQPITHRANKNALQAVESGARWVSTAFDDLGTIFSNFGNREVAKILHKTSFGLYRMATGLARFASGDFIGGGLSLFAGFSSIFGEDHDQIAQVLSAIQHLESKIDEGFHQINQRLEALQRDIHAVGNMVSQVGRMVSQVLANQKIIFDALERTFAFLSDFDRRVREHIVVAESRLEAMDMASINDPASEIKKYLKDKGAALFADEQRLALQKMERWLESGCKAHRNNAVIYAGMSAERTLPILYSALLPKEQRISAPGFLAEELWLLFGDISLKKYTHLPFTESFLETAQLYLDGIEKSGIESGDACASVCDDIQKTIDLNLEFIDFLKNNTTLQNALFDKYEYYRDKLGRAINLTDAFSGNLSIDQILQDSTRPGHAKKQIEEILDAIEKVRLLLHVVAKYIDGDMPGDFTRRVAKLESKDAIRDTVPKSESCKALTMHYEIKDDPKEQYRVLLRRGQNLAGENQLWFYAHELPKTPGYIAAPKASDGTPAFYLQQTTDMLLLHLMQEPVDPAKDKTFLLDAKSQLALGCFGSCWNVGMIHYKSRHPYIRSTYNSKDKKPYNYSTLVLYSLMNCKFEFDTSTPCPPEEAAFLADITNANGLYSRAKLKTAFDYYLSFIKGDLKTANTYLTPQNKIDPYCLLLLVCILGRWDAFDYCHPLCIDFDFTRTVANGKLTPLMIAAEHGREDVIDGLLLHYKDSVGLNLTMQYQHNDRIVRTEHASSLALYQGHLSCANKLLAAMPGKWAPGMGETIAKALEDWAIKNKKNDDAMIAIPSTDNDLQKKLRDEKKEVEKSKELFAKILPKLGETEARKKAAEAEKAEAMQTEIEELRERLLQQAQTSATAAQSNAVVETDEDDDDDKFQHFQTETQTYCAVRGIVAATLWRKPTDVPELNKPGCRVAKIPEKNDRKALSDALKTHGIIAEKARLCGEDHLVVSLPTVGVA